MINAWPVEQKIKKQVNYTRLPDNVALPTTLKTTVGLYYQQNNQNQAWPK
jgi:hypothetical protein